MKALLFGIVFIIINFSVSLANTIPTSTLRKLFHNAVLDPAKIPEFTSRVLQITSPTPIEMAYQAAAEALKAQEEWNPVEKFLYLRNFKKTISKAIELDAHEIEIRFLRFGIEYNIPGVLGYSKDMHEDKTMILDSILQVEQIEIDKFFTIYIITLLADSGLFTLEEIDLVKSKIKT
jgi:hypothetical protein